MFYGAYYSQKSGFVVVVIFFFINRLFTMMKVWYIVVNIDGLIKQNPNPSMGQWMSSFEASGKAFLG